MRSHDRIGLDGARRRLAWVWFVGVAVIGAILLLQMMLDTYRGAFPDALNWAAPHLAPTSGLVIATFSKTATRAPTGRQPTVDGFFLRLAVSIAAAHLFLILVFLLGGGIFAEFRQAEDRVAAHFDLLDVGNLWLALLQGGLAAVFGAVFFTEEGDAKEQGG